MKNTKAINFIRVLTFNIIETVIIFLLGNIFNVDMNIRIMLMMIFFITRMIIGEPKHYKKAYKCALWSSLVFLSLYSLSNLDIYAIIILTIFTGFISTGKADILDMYMWTGKTSKYEALKDLVAISPNNSIILEHEDYWRKNYPIRYEIFKYYFRENKSYQEIAEIKGFPDNTILKKECATIYSILEKPLGLPPI